MELLEALKNRRSIRKYTSEAISQEDIDTLLHAAMSGPSAANKRPWDFFVVTDTAVLEKLRAAGRYTNMAAPLAIVVCGNLSRSLPDHLAQYWIHDCSAASENILLAATALGLGAVWCGAYPQDSVQERISAALGLSDEQIPLNIIFIGHPDQTQPPRDQYNAEYIHYIK